jgi:glycosyltransferase involved in cell wall biosynthesis
MSISAIELGGRRSEYGWKQTSTDFALLTPIFATGDTRAFNLGQLLTTTANVLDTIGPAVVALPGWSDSGMLAALHWSISRGVPAVLMSESAEADQSRAFLVEFAKSQLVRLFPAALVGGQRHAHYVRRLGAPRDRVYLGYDVVDNQYFDEHSRRVRRNRQELMWRYGLPRSFFLASARFVPKKNLGALIRGYALYRHRARTDGVALNRIWDLVLLGDGPLSCSLQLAVAQQGLTGLVRMPGFKQYDELPVYYGLASCFVHASTVEQWGLVVNEAMASGLPVLVSDRCGCSVDLVMPGLNGLIFDPFNTDQLAQLMLRLAGMTEDERAQMGRQSLQIIAQWGPERFGRGLQAAVEAAMQQGPVSASIAQRLLLKLLLYGRCRSSCASNLHRENGAC